MIMFEYTIIFRVTWQRPMGFMGSHAMSYIIISETTSRSNSLWYEINHVACTSLCVISLVLSVAEWTSDLHKWTQMRHFCNILLHITLRMHHFALRSSITDVIVVRRINNISIYYCFRFCGCCAQFSPHVAYTTNGLAKHPTIYIWYLQCNRFFVHYKRKAMMHKAVKLY